MRRLAMLAKCAVRGDLIIARNNTRMRVQSVEPVSGGITVIIIGRNATGMIGIAHSADESVIKLE